MAWQAADFEALAEQRTIEGRLGVQYVPLIAGRPPIGVDLSGVANAILAGHLDNDRLLARVMAIPEGPPPAPDSEAAAAPAPEAEGATLTALWDTTRKVLSWQDAVLAAFIVDPPYCSMEKLPRGGCPPGQLCWQDFSAEERREAVALIYAPAERLASFRGEPAGAVAGADGGEVGAPAESVGAAAGADVPAVVAGRGAIPPATAAGGRRRGGASAGAPSPE